MRVPLLSTDLHGGSMVWSLVTAACPLTQIIPQPVPIRALGTEHGGGHFSVSSQNSCRRIANALGHEARDTKDGAIFGVGFLQEKGWQATQSHYAACHIKWRGVPSGYTPSGTTLVLIFTSTIEPMEHHATGWLIEQA